MSRSLTIKHLVLPAFEWRKSLFVVFWRPQVDSGDLRPLVTWGAERAANWPSVPTLRETGVDIAVKAPYGLAGPKGIDPKVIKILHDAFKRGMEDPALYRNVGTANRTFLLHGCRRVSRLGDPEPRGLEKGDR